MVTQLTQTLADPGQERKPQRSGHEIIILVNLPSNCMKMKNIGPRVECAALARPVPRIRQLVNT